MTRNLISQGVARLYLAGIIITMFAVAMAEQQSVSGTSSAFDQGYQDGRNDFLDRNSKNPYCDPDNSSSNPDAFCASYKAGYEAGWLAASLLYGNQ